MHAPLLVMIHHNRPDLTRLCVSSLRAHTAPPYRLLLIDNASGHDLKSLAPDELIINRSPQVFAANCNIGLRAIEEGPAVLLNNDLFFPPGWLEGLLRGLDQGHGVVGALSNTEVPLNLTVGGHPLKLGARGEPKELSGHWQELSRVLGTFNQEGRNRAQALTPMVAFFAVALSPRVIEDVGLLEERFAQGFEDLDYCLRAWEAGYTVAQALDAYVIHFGERSTPEAGPAELAARDAHNLPLLLDRWPEPRREALFNCWTPHGLESEARRMWELIDRRVRYLRERGVI